MGTLPFFLILSCVGADLILKDTEYDIIQEAGDLTIGAFVNVFTPAPTGDTCLESIQLSRMKQTLVYQYTIKEINQDPTILPNITLGLVLLPTCGRDVNQLARVMSFLPNAECADGTNETGTIELYKVQAVIGLRSSREAVMTSSVLSLFQIPNLSAYATSDELSDKSRFGYFLRTVSPDKYQAYAMVSFLKEMNWTYVAFLYSEGSYGENAARQVENLVKQSGDICFAMFVKVPTDGSTEYFDDLIEQMKKNRNAKIIPMFLNERHIKSFTKMLEQKGELENFILLGSDFYFQERHGIRGDGMLSLMIPTTPYPGFDEYLRNLTPDNNPGNPWFKRYWEIIYNCKWEDNGDNSNCPPGGTNAEDAHYAQTSAYRDVVIVLAQAMHKLIQTKCPEMFLDPTHVTDCVTGPDLLGVLKKEKFQGTNDVIDFDKFGDMFGSYDVTQYSLATGIKTKVATWSRKTMAVEVEFSSFDWSRKMLPRPMNEYQSVPESVCSRPCQAKEYTVQKEQVCCWECRTCRNNEFITENGTACETCPTLTWPDDTTGTTCLLIGPTYMLWSSGNAIALGLVAGLGVIASLTVAAFYAKNHKHKLIKASGRELSVFTLCGIVMAHGTVFAFIAKPDLISCNVSRYGFNISVTLLYGPLLLKTLRIYRIFKSGGQGQQGLKLIGRNANVVACIVVIFLQIVLSVVTGIIAPAGPRLRMKVPTESHVELFCDLPLEGFLAPLAFNILLVIACALFGFLTRKLPENFNESWFIFISVSTTSFLWAVFLPTYFTQFYAYNQAALLAFCLLLNAAIPLCCLYVPKIYAVYFVDIQKLTFNATTTNAPGTVSTVTGSAGN